jgi:clumping factor A
MELNYYNTLINKDIFDSSFNTFHDYSLNINFDSLYNNYLDSSYNNYFDSSFNIINDIRFDESGNIVDEKSNIIINYDIFNEYHDIEINNIFIYNDEDENEYYNDNIIYNKIENTNSQSDNDTNTDTNSQSDNDTNTDTNSQSDNDTNTDTNSQSDNDTNSNSENSQSDNDTNTDTNSQSDNDTNSNSENSINDEYNKSIVNLLNYNTSHPILFKIWSNYLNVKKMQFEKSKNELLKAINYANNTINNINNGTLDMREEYIILLLIYSQYLSNNNI